MPATTLTVHKAVQNFWENTLAFANKPNSLWFGETALRDKSGQPVELPIAEIEDGGTEFRWDFLKNPIETTTVTITVRADSLETAEQVMLGARFNGSAPTATAGLDWCQGLSVTNAAVKEVRPLRGSFGKESYRGKTARLVFWRRMTYSIEILRTGA